jgi:hypothetical protein
MYQPHNTNSAAARAMRIRRDHDMEATTLDTMHRHSENEKPGLLARFAARLQRRTATTAQPVGLEPTTAERATLSPPGTSAVAP